MLVMTEDRKYKRHTSFQIQRLFRSPAHPETELHSTGLPRPPPSQPSIGSARGLDAVGATLITAVSILILSRFQKHGLINILEEFPVRRPYPTGHGPELTASRQTCDASITDRLSLIPNILQPLASCEVLIFDLFLLTSLHWYIAFSLLGGNAWKEKHMTSVGTITIAGTVLGATIVKDQAALFLVVTPLIMDLAMMGCWAVDWEMMREE